MILLVCVMGTGGCFPIADGLFFTQQDLQVRVTQGATTQPARWIPLAFCWNEADERVNVETNTRGEAMVRIPTQTFICSGPWYPGVWHKHRKYALRNQLTGTTGCFHVEHDSGAEEIRGTIEPGAVWQGRDLQIRVLSIGEAQMRDETGPGREQGA